MRIAQANSRVGSNGEFLDDLVLCRQQGDVPLTPKDRIDYMDVAPEQLVSIAAAASLVMGQAGEGRPIVLVRGIPYARRDGSARELLRERALDFFR